MTADTLDRLGLLLDQASRAGRRYAVVVDSLHGPVLAKTTSTRLAAQKWADREYPGAAHGQRGKQSTYVRVYDTSTRQRITWTP